MSRRRMIDPNIWQSEDMSKLSVFDRLLFIGMISNADDEGRGRAHSSFLKSIIFPYDEIDIDDINTALSRISSYTSVVIYEVNGKRYYAFKNWKCWQRVDKPTKSIFPPPPDNSGIIPESVENPSGITPDELLPKRKEEKRREVEEKRKEEKHARGEYHNVLLSDTDLEKLQEEYPSDYEQRIESLSAYIASTGKTYKNHLATIRNWARMEKERQGSGSTTKNSTTGNPFLKMLEDMEDE